MHSSLTVLKPWGSLGVTGGQSAQWLNKDTQWCIDPSSRLGYAHVWATGRAARPALLCDGTLEHLQCYISILLVLGLVVLSHLITITVSFCLHLRQCSGVNQPTVELLFLQGMRAKQCGSQNQLMRARKCFRFVFLLHLVNVRAFYVVPYCLVLIPTNSTRHAWTTVPWVDLLSL